MHYYSHVDYTSLAYWNHLLTIQATTSVGSPLDAHGHDAFHDNQMLVTDEAHSAKSVDGSSQPGVTVKIGSSSCPRCPRLSCAVSAIVAQQR